MQPCTQHQAPAREGASPGPAGKAGNGAWLAGANRSGARAGRAGGGGGRAQSRVGRANRLGVRAHVLPAACGGGSSREGGATGGAGLLLVAPGGRGRAGGGAGRAGVRGVAAGASGRAGARGGVGEFLAAEPCRRGPGLVLGEPRERPRWRDVGFSKRLWGRWSGRVVAPGRRAGLGASGREEGAGGGRAGRCVRARPWGSGLCARRGHLPGPQPRLPGLSGVRGNFSVSVTSEDCRAVGVTGCPCDRLFSLCPVRLAHEREGTAEGTQSVHGPAALQPQERVAYPATRRAAVLISVFISLESC